MLKLLILGFLSINSCLYTVAQTSQYKIDKLVNFKTNRDHIKTFSYPVNDIPGKVISLKIENLNIVKPLDLSIFNNLQELIISNCHLGKVKIDFSNYELLQYLSINNCTFDTLVFTGKGYFFRELCLYNTHLYNYDFLEQIEVIHELVLSDTNTIDINNLSKNLVKLKYLYCLSITDGNIKELPESFSKLESLWFLKFNDMDPEFNYSLLFERISNLKINSLYLTYNRYLKTLPSNVGSLKNLKTLSLISSSVSSLPPEIGELYSLEKLDVSETLLDTLPSSIVNLKNLNTLILLAEFKSLPQILLKLTWLRELQIRSYEWEPNYQELFILRKTLSSCKVNEFKF